MTRAAQASAGRGARAPLAVAAALVPLWVLATPAPAGTFTPPAGCEGWMTVQQRSCRVSNHYRCASDAPGDQWRADFGLNGAYFRSRIDYETQWVESHESNGTVDLLLPGALDPANFSTLVGTGRDTFQFATQNSAGLREHIEGYDSLTGVTVIIDGVPLLQTKYEVRATDDTGRLIWHSRGNEYIHPEWRVFLAGTGQTDLGEGFLPQDFSPVDFAFPGEPGFMATIPLYDCEAMTAEARLP